MKKNLSWEYFLILVCFSMITIAPTFAENTSTPSSAASADSNTTSTQKFFLLTDSDYRGSTFSHMNGDFGDGSNLWLRNYVIASYKVFKNWQVVAAPGFILRTAPRELSGTAKLTYVDPFIGIANSSLISARNEDFNIRIDMRYYAPISPSTKFNVGTEGDRGNGKGYFRVLTENYFGNSNFSLQFDWTVNHHFAKEPQGAGIADAFELYNMVQYQVSKYFGPYIGYTVYPEHRNDGTWARWVKTHAVETGLVWNPNQRLAIIPIFESPFLLKDTKVIMLIRWWAI